MADRADAEQDLALEKLALRFADVHVHHGIELERGILAAPELLLRTPVRRRGTDDRQHQMRAVAHRFRKLDEILQRLGALEPRDARDLRPRRRGQVFCVEADGRLVLPIRQGERQAASHSRISHRGDGIQAPM